MSLFAWRLAREGPRHACRPLQPDLAATLVNMNAAKRTCDRHIAEAKSESHNKWHWTVPGYYLEGVVHGVIRYSIALCGRAVIAVRVYMPLSCR